MGIVYTKSPKGSREANGRTQDLPPPLHALLLRCKGRFTVAMLCEQAAGAEHEDIAAAIRLLVEEGYLREAPEALLDEEFQDEPEFDDDTTDAAAPATDVATAAETDAAVDDPAEKLRAGVARRRGERDEETSELVRQFDEEARRKAEEKAAREAEEQARRAAEEAARRAAEEEARRAAEEAARRAAEEEARRQAAEEARRQAEEEKRRAEEERRRKAAERKAAEEARERARLEEEERDRLAIQERLRKRREQQRRILWPLALGIVLPLLLGALFLQVYSFDARRAAFEAAATEILGTPVKAGDSKLWFAPGPQWRFNDVVIGTGADGARIARVSLDGSWGGIFAAPGFAAIHLVDPQLPTARALALLHDASGRSGLAAGTLRASGLRFTDLPKDLPPLSLDAAFRDGRLVTVAGQGASEEAGKLGFALAHEGGWQLRLEASQLRWLLGAELPLSEIRAKGQLESAGLRFDEFAATLLSGDLSGSGRLSWEGGWRLAGKFDLRRLEASRLARGWLGEGLLTGSATVLAGASSARELVAKSQLSGNATVERGALNGVDLDKVLEGRSMGEQTRFDTLTADVSIEGQRVELANVKLGAPGLKAAGSLRIDTDRSAAGRLVVEADTRISRNAVALKVGGTAAAPNYQR